VEQHWGQEGGLAMGMARLNIWVSGTDDPCSVDDKTWYIIIYDCDGRVLEWCDRRYVVLPAKCGHLEVEVPPGCYFIRAVWGYGRKVAGLWGNHFTEATIVQARCEETVCVKLFNPSAHRCGYIYKLAIADMVAAQAIDRELAKRLHEAIDGVLEHIPIPEKKFEMGHEEEIARLVKEHEAKQTKR
jgi:hypothetical protein